MPKSATFISLGTISLDRSDHLPLYRQLYQSLRDAILSGQFAPGTRLPSTRALAQELGVSRNTAVNAYEQLIAEGFLESQIGSGTCVIDTLPDEIQHVKTRRNREKASSAAARMIPPPRLSERGTRLASTPFVEKSQARAFCPGLPAIDAFPLKVWGKLLHTSWQNLSISQLGYNDVMGYWPLREAIVRYLQTARGVRCTPEQVLITNGAQQALALSAALLLNRGDAAWLENPCYHGAKAALHSVGASIVPVTVDENGLVVNDGIAKAPYARLAIVSPSHQYPLGVTMSLTRRLQLLQWVHDAQAWILEDDYDSAYRYGGNPLAALQGLDDTGRVIYIGTFSKALLPSLRLGYMIVPPPLIEAFRALRAHADRGNALLEQVALTQFIAQGHFARHIRRMRSLYEQRQAVLVDAVKRYLDGLLLVEPNDTGLHLVGRLPEGVDDQLISRKLLAQGIDARALSSYTITPLSNSGLLLGYTAIPAAEIVAAVKQMKPILADCVG
ncbi:MAG: PLP-dependent aminotransferase family protein [Ardenticatenaceae bacterium]